MMNFFLTPTDMKYNSSNSNNMKIMQTKIPQTVVSDKETFNDRTRKSLLKINLFIKRLKWFNIFTTATIATTTTTTEAAPAEIDSKIASKIPERKQPEQQKW